MLELISLREGGAASRDTDVDIGGQDRGTLPGTGTVGDTGAVTQSATQLPLLEDRPGLGHRGAPGARRLPRAVRDLLDGPYHRGPAHPPNDLLNEQTATLNASSRSARPWLDLAYQLLGDRDSRWYRHCSPLHLLNRTGPLG